MHSWLIASPSPWTTLELVQDPYSPYLQLLRTTFALHQSQFKTPLWCWYRQSADSERIGEYLCFHHDFSYFCERFNVFSVGSSSGMYKRVRVHLIESLFALYFHIYFQGIYLASPRQSCNMVAFYNLTLIL